MQMKSGALEVGRLSGVPVRIHWSALLGAFVFTGFSMSPARLLCYFGLIVVHELGHALVVKAFRAEALAIDVTGYGGLCWWRGHVSPIGGAAIAWGGVWAQLIVLVLALAVGRLTAPSSNFYAWEAMWALTGSNAWMIALNLLPIKPLDGAEAWALPILLGRRLRARLGTKRPSSPKRPDSPLSERDDAFDAGELQPEVSAIVSSLLEGARKKDQP